MIHRHRQVGIDLGSEVFDADFDSISDRTIGCENHGSGRTGFATLQGIRVQDSRLTQPMDHYVRRITDDTISAAASRVTGWGIRDLITRVIAILIESRAVSKAGMGACGA